MKIGTFVEIIYPLSRGYATLIDVLPAGLPITEDKSFYFGPFGRRRFVGQSASVDRYVFKRETPGHFIIPETKLNGMVRIVSESPPPNHPHCKCILQPITEKEAPMPKQKAYYVVSALRPDSNHLGTPSPIATEKEAIERAQSLINQRMVEGRKAMAFHVLKVVAIVQPEAVPVTVTKLK